jgi:mxaJ protein
MSVHRVRWPALVIAACALAIILIAAARCWRAWRATAAPHATGPAEAERLSDRTLAAWGLALAGLCGVLVVGQAYPACVLAPDELARANGRPASGGLTWRICTPPDNVPFSDRTGGGLEDALARRLATSIGADVTTVWAAPGPGWLRRSLKADRCDVVLGMVPGSGPVLATRPYYRTGYAFVTRSADAPVQSFDDARLRGWRIGIPLVGDDGAASPVALALAQRGLVTNVRGFPVLGHSPREIVDAFTRGEIEVAVLWGPVAAYVVRQAPSSLKLALAPAADHGVPLAFDVAMAVRPADRARAEALDRVLLADKPAIDAILARFGVPRLDGSS